MLAVQIINRDAPHELVGDSRFIF